MKQLQVQGNRPLIRLLDRTKSNTLQRIKTDSQVSTIYNAKIFSIQLKKIKHTKKLKDVTNSHERKTPFNKNRFQEDLNVEVSKQGL